jgi:hypothetical protein
MGAASWVTTESELSIARTGITIQAEAHGLDLTDPKIKAFIEHQIKVVASLNAGMRWQSNIIHNMTGEVQR